MSSVTIHVRNWEKFQHADVTKRGRPPAWIRLYTELLSDENYLRLTPTRRAMLIGIWVEYARTRRELPDDTASLSRRLAQRVLRSDLEALEEAGFVTLSNARAHAELTLSARARRREKKPSINTEPLNHEADNEFRQDAVTPPASLEERRGETTVRSTGSVDVAALDLEALSQPARSGVSDPHVDEVRFTPFTDMARDVMEATQAELVVQDELAARRGRGEVNGRPMRDVIGGMLDEMRGETG